MFYLILGLSLHPDEEACLRQSMQNNARLQQLGLSVCTAAFARATTINKDKSKKQKRNREDSESDYDPSQDDSVEQDLDHDDIAKVITLPSYQGLF